MSRRGLDDPLPLPERERTWLDDDRRRAALLERRHGLVHLAHVGHLSRSQLHAQRLGRLLGSLKPGLAVRPPRVPEIVDRRPALAQVPGDLHVLAAEVGEHVTDPGRVAARASQAVDESDPDGVADADEHDRQRRALPLRRQRRAGARRDQDPGAALHELTRGPRVLGVARDPHHVERDVPIVDEAHVAQTMPERLDERPVIRVGRGAERQEAQPGRARRRLRPRGDRRDEKAKGNDGADDEAPGARSGAAARSATDHA
jgi:hypothetical protein